MALIDNIIAYYKAEWNANAEVWTNGTFTSPSYTTWKIWQWFNFTTSNYVNCGDVYNIEYNLPFTKSFWHKSTDAGAAVQLLSKQDSVTTFWTWIEMNWGKYWCWLYQTSTSIRRQTTSTYNDWNWHHIVITYSGSGAGSGVIFYVDWVSVANSSIWGTDTINQTMVNATWFQINWRWNSTNSTHTWVMDEIWIWSRVLSWAEITQLYNGWVGLSYPFTIGSSAMFAFFL